MEKPGAENAERERIRDRAMELIAQALEPLREEEQARGTAWKTYQHALLTALEGKLCIQVATWISVEVGWEPSDASKAEAAKMGTRLAVHLDGAVQGLIASELAPLPEGGPYVKVSMEDPAERLRLRFSGGLITLLGAARAEAERDGLDPKAAQTAIIAAATNFLAYQTIVSCYPPERLADPTQRREEITRLCERIDGALNAFLAWELDKKAPVEGAGGRRGGVVRVRPRLGPGFDPAAGRAFREMFERINKLTDRLLREGTVRGRIQWEHFRAVCSAFVNNVVTLALTESHEDPGSWTEAAQQRVMARLVEAYDAAVANEKVLRGVPMDPPEGPGRAGHA